LLPEDRTEPEESTGKEPRQSEGEPHDETAGEAAILETGEVSFFYRPKVSVEEALTVDDVQRLFVILRPERVRPNDSPLVKSISCGAHNDQEAKKDDGSAFGKLRMIIIGKKKLPDVNSHEKCWGFVEHAVLDPKEIEQLLGGKTYDTASGTKLLQASRPLGEGTYTVVKKERQTYFAYVLSTAVGEFQQAFNIVQEGSYALSIKNPTTGNRPSNQGLSNGQSANFPPRLTDQHSGLRFFPAQPTEFLDYEGCEILLIGASEDVEKNLGEAGEELEKLEREREEFLELDE